MTASGREPQDNARNASTNKQETLRKRRTVPQRTSNSSTRGASAAGALRLSSSHRSLTPKEEAVMAAQHDILNDNVKVYSVGIIVYVPLLASFLTWLRGDIFDQYGPPMVAALLGLTGRLIGVYGYQVTARTAQKIETVTVTFALTAMILRHAILYHGCSACVLQAIYGVVPCFAAFLFRTTKAIHYSAAYVMLLLTILYGVDLSGNCPSEPSGLWSSKVTERLIPMIMLIVGNTTILSGIVRNLQDSLLVQAKAAIEAEKLAAMRRDVLHRVTHELRTPLNGLLGSVELLATSDDVTEGDMEHVLTMKRCLSSVLGICDDVLTIAKADQVETTKEVLHHSPSLSNLGDGSNEPYRQPASKKKPFVLASVVDDVVDMFGASIANKGVELQVDFRSPTTATYFGEAIKLRQVLLNLVGNALKFTNEGSITIRVIEEPPSAQSDGDVDEESISQGSFEDASACWFKFEVEDTGIGIDPEEAALLFEPFHQGEQNQGGAVSRSFKGTGLGLSICREFVGQMDGEIWADGSPDGGSCFTFTACLDKMADQPCGMRANSRVLLLNCTDDMRQSCRSIIQSIAPGDGTEVETISSQDELQRFLETEDSIDFPSHRTDDTNNPSLRIALVQCDPSNSHIDSNLADLKRMGWKLILFADRNFYSNIRRRWAEDTYAIFRTPLRLGIVGETFEAALCSKKAPHRNSTDVSSLLMSPRGTPKKKSSFSPGQDKNVKRSLPTPTNVTASPIALPSITPPLSVENDKKKEGPTSPHTKVPKKKPGKLALGPNTKIMVVDDTALNVKVLVKMLSRLTSATIMTCSDGQEAVEMVISASPSDELLIFMDWHMPGVCGLTATDMIRKYVDGRGTDESPSVQVCMLTADIEGLYVEMDTRGISYDGTVTKGEYVPSHRAHDPEQTLSLEMVAGKPVTFQTIKAIFRGFQSTMY